jgi:hypothetical protein
VTADWGRALDSLATPLNPPPPAQKAWKGDGYSSLYFALPLSSQQVKIGPLSRLHLGLTCVNEHLAEEQQSFRAKISNVNK